MSQWSTTLILLQHGAEPLRQGLEGLLHQALATNLLNGGVRKVVEMSRR